MSITCTVCSTGRLNGIVGLLSISLFLLSGLISYLLADDACCGQKKSGFVTRNVRYMFTVSNTTGKISKGGELRVFAPALKSARQYDTTLSASVPYRLVSHEDGSQVFTVDLGTIAPWGKKVVTFSGKVLLSQNPLTSGSSGKDGISTVESRFLKPEEYIECANAQIETLAQKLQRKTDMATVKSIYSWVKSNLKKDVYTGQIKGALPALRSLKGDCTEFACLITALCRAVNIPARVVGGFIVSKNMILAPANHHDWAEVFVDGKWRVVDGHSRNCMKREEDYIVFRFLGSEDSLGGLRRYRIIGDGLSVKMEGRNRKGRAKNQPCNCG